ncbi:hypothetical protein NDU88_007520 [Pleurodeles waltl]|uniref:Uncharacterized protein n=1 Tax=Pleurodeles waltl TaxID=8319 RepID=A0AAV7SSR7_PLEWA|nr:hypothetical protein NDU88_007520 [Pleurodeles waltl]
MYVNPLQCVSTIRVVAITDTIMLSPSVVAGDHSGTTAEEALDLPLAVIVQDVPLQAAFRRGSDDCCNKSEQ